jgi:ankyrin repeat protein
VAEVKRLLKKGATLEFYFEEEDDDTPLIVAVQSGSLEMVRFILEEAHRQDLESLSILDGGNLFLDSQSWVYGTPLYLAVQSGYSAIASLLLSYDASPSVLCKMNGMSAIHAAAECGDTRFLRKLIARPTSCISHLAAGSNYEFLSLPDRDWATPLHIAAHHQQLKMVQFLLSHYVPVDEKDEQGLTPLHYAIMAEVKDEPSQKSATSRVRRSAKTRARMAIVAELVAAEAKVDACDKKGRTPLHYAASMGDTEIIKVLLQAGASRIIRAASGERPVDEAKRAGHADAAELLAVKPPRAKPKLPVRSANQTGRKNSVRKKKR